MSKCIFTVIIKQLKGELWKSYKNDDLIYLGALKSTYFKRILTGPSEMK